MSEYEAKRSEDDELAAVTSAARELLEDYPRWPLWLTLALVLALAGVAGWLLAAGLVAG